MVEKTCSDPALALGRHFQTMVFSLAIDMASLLDPDAIAVALLYHLPSLNTGVSREALDRLLNVPTQDSRSTVVRDLMRFSGMEWNTWPAVPSTYRSERTAEMLRNSFLFAVGPVTADDWHSSLYLETASHNREKVVPNLVNLLRTVSTDWRVPVIKIAERICLTRMLSSADVREVIPVDPAAYARINLAVYAALADRQGIWHLKSALEDVSLVLLDPAAYRSVELAMSTQESREAEKLNHVIVAIQECLSQAGISNATVYGRRKHIYSIYRKMKSKRLSPDEMIDLIGVRVIVHPELTADAMALSERLSTTAAARDAADSEVRAAHRELKTGSEATRKKLARVKDGRLHASRVHSQAMRDSNQASHRAEQAAVQRCYDAFAVLRERWSPVRDVYGPYDMRDWIRYPKENGYQSLHAAFLMDGSTVEVQIRTQSMHEQAEYGTAAYSRYKSEKNYGSLQPPATVGDS